MANIMQLDASIEAVLFYKAGPVAKSVLTKLFSVTDAELQDAIHTLRERLESGAIRLVETDSDLTLATAPEHDTLIESLRKDELRREIGKAGAETLAIVLYRGPISRTEIDRIRGVNSGYILRNLAMRDLIERTSSQKRVEYQITPALLRHLGITKKQALPQYEAILNQLNTYEMTLTETEAGNDNTA